MTQKIIKWIKWKKKKQQKQNLTKTNTQKIKITK